MDSSPLLYAVIGTRATTLCPLGQDDIRMPDFNGVEAIERIQREYGDARIIVLTTYTGDVQNRPLQVGVFGHP